MRMEALGARINLSEVIFFINGKHQADVFWRKSFRCGIMLIMTLGQVFIMPVKNDNLHECGGCSALKI